MTPAAPSLFDSQPAKTGEKWQPVIDPAKRPRFDMSMMTRHAKPRDLPHELTTAAAKAEKRARRMKSRTRRQIAADIDTERAEAQNERGSTPEE